MMTHISVVALFGTMALLAAACIALDAEQRGSWLTSLVVAGLGGFLLYIGTP